MFRCQGKEEEHASIQQLLAQFAGDHLIQFKECLPPSEHGAGAAGADWSCLGALAVALCRAGSLQVAVVKTRECNAAHVLPVIYLDMASHK